MTSKKALFPADGFGEKKRGQSLTSRTRFVLFTLSFLIYILLFVIVGEFLGRGMAILAVIPVIVTARLYGLWPGLAVALLTWPINYFIYGFNSAWVDSRETLFLGTIGLMLVGIAIGRLRDISLKLKKEIHERQQAEEDLKKHRDELDSLVKQKTSELRDINEKLEYLIDASLDPIILNDKSGRIIRTNDAFLKMLGYSEAEVMGALLNSFIITDVGTYDSSAGEFIHIDPKVMEDSKKATVSLYETGKLRSWKTYFMGKQGKAIPATTNMVLIYNKSGEISGSFGIIHDITEQRKAEIEHIRSKEEAEAANTAKSAFLANMSHEIRTPMNGVIGFTDMLINSGLNSEQDDFAWTIKRSGETLLSLINDILDFSKIEAGKITIEEIDFDIEMLAYDVCEIIKPRIVSRDVEMLCRIDDNLPATVKGDPHRFRQVLTNLLGNAAKFTEKGEIELSLHVEHEYEDRMLIVAKVRDSGIGIPEEQLDSIFDVFVQVDGSTTRKYGGSGLGLSICKKIAVLMGGDITVKSEPGAGSTFMFSSWVMKPEKREAERLNPVSLFGKKVLITDDNRTNIDILNYILKTAGMVVTACSSGGGAIKAVVESYENSEPFDICIFDIMMPGMNGYDMAKQIREKYGDSLPLLAFSSSIDDSAKSCLNAGFNGFLPKPINRVKLFKMMIRLLFEAGGQTEDGQAKTKIITQHSMQEDEKHSISILMAEDNKVNQKLILKLLTKAGYQVKIVDNGKEAVDVFSSAPDRYDVIIMDVQMPEMNGLDATKLLREKGFQDIPIIAMTANALKGDREKCLEAGMDDYISKPIKREIVFEVLRKWVIDRIR